MGIYWLLCSIKPGVLVPNGRRLIWMAVAFEEVVASDPPIEAVIHTASPCNFSCKNPKNELFPPGKDIWSLKTVWMLKYISD